MESTLSPQLKEARSLQDVGCLNDANRHFDLALSDDPDNILLTLEAAGNKLAQRLIGEAHTMVSALEARIDRENPDLDPLHIALLDSFISMTTYTMTAKFKDPLHRSLDSYTKYALGQPVESFSKHVVCRVRSSGRTMSSLFLTPPYVGYHYMSLSQPTGDDKNHVLST
jgi:hypothetical protein